MALARQTVGLDIRQNEIRVWFFDVLLELRSSTARADRHRIPEPRREALLANATQGHVAVAVAARVDSAEFAVVSVGKTITRVGRGDEPFIRKTGNDLANSIILQDDEIAVAVRKAILAIQPARISGRQSPSYGRQVASLVRILSGVAQLLVRC
jgi:hypothetical protein